MGRLQGGRDEGGGRKAGTSSFPWVSGSSLFPLLRFHGDYVMLGAVNLDERRRCRFSLQ